MTEWPPPVPTEWPADLTKLVAVFQKLQPCDLPPAPWVLAPGLTITCNDTWLTSVKLEVATGSSGTRFRFGVLQEDLRWLKQRVKEHRAKVAGRPAPPPYTPTPIPRPKQRRGADAIETKADALGAIAGLMRETKVSRRDVNATLKRRCNRTLGSARREDLDWLVQTLRESKKGN